MQLEAQAAALYEEHRTTSGLTNAILSPSGCRPKFKRFLNSAEDFKKLLTNRFKPDTSIASKLLDAKAAVDQQGHVGTRQNITSLWYAARHFVQPQMVRVLLDAKAEINCRSSDNVAPLATAGAHCAVLDCTGVD